MKTFFNVEDLGDLKAALAEAQEVKANRFGYQELGKNKTLLMIFFNNSLRTRLSTQKAAMNLGMNVIVLDVNAGAWKLETERGVIMDGDKSEHLLEAIPVMGSFCDLIGVRSFAGLKDRDYDYAETIVNQFEVQRPPSLRYGDSYRSPTPGIRRPHHHRGAQEGGWSKGSPDLGSSLPCLASGCTKLIRPVDECSRCRFRGYSP